MQHHLLHVVVLVNIEMCEEYEFTNIYVDSDEETVIDDNEIIDEILRSNENLHSYEQYKSCFTNNRNNTTVSYRTNDKYNSSTSLDPFVRSLDSINDHHHHYQIPSIIQKYAVNILIKHFLFYNIVNI